MPKVNKKRSRLERLNPEFLQQGTTSNWYDLTVEQRFYLIQEFKLTGMTYEEIGDKLKISSSTVRKLYNGILSNSQPGPDTSQSTQEIDSNPQVKTSNSNRTLENSGLETLNPHFLQQGTTSNWHDLTVEERFYLIEELKLTGMTDQEIANNVGVNYPIILKYNKVLFFLPEIKQRVIFNKKMLEQTQLLIETQLREAESSIPDTSQTLNPDQSSVITFDSTTEIWTFLLNLLEINLVGESIVEPNTLDTSEQVVNFGQDEGHSQ